MRTKEKNVLRGGNIYNSAWGKYIQELLNLAKQIATAQKEGDKLGLTADELAFYDALTNPQAIKDFYENEELIAITKELADALRKNRTIDWQKREPARARMRMMIKRLLKNHRYPPEGMDDAVQTVMTQCELWTDNEPAANPISRRKRCAKIHLNGRFSKARMRPSSTRRRLRLCSAFGMVAAD